MAASNLCASIDVAGGDGGNNLVKNLRPVFCSLRVLGIDLDVGQPRSITRRCLFFLFYMSLMALVIAANCIHVMSLKVQGLPTTVDLWCGLLQKGTRLVSSILLQLAVYSATQLKWKSLWNRIEDLGHSIRGRRNVQMKMRLVPVWLLVIVISGEAVDKLVGGLYSVRLKKLYRGGVEAVEVVGIVIGEVYECFLVILFLALIWLASSSIELITEDVLDCDEMDGRAIKWRQNYCSIAKFIADMDATFGPALIVLISKQFIFFVVYSFRICQQVAKNGPMVFSTIYLARNLFLMSMLIIGSQRVKNKVINLIQSSNFEYLNLITLLGMIFQQASALVDKLNTCLFAASKIQIDVYYLISEIYQKPPILSPMGIFELKPTIIPTCIGTTVTYLLVMASFASAQL